jgi:agmatinase
MDNLTAPRTGHKTLLYSELVTDLTDFKADIAVLGVPFGAAYGPRQYSNDQTNAPQAHLRDLSDAWCVIPATMTSISMARCCRSARISASSIAAMSCPTWPSRSCTSSVPRAPVRQIMRGGACIVLGGDHGITNPVLRGFDEVGPITLVHIDAHLDWRDGSTACATACPA